MSPLKATAADAKKYERNLTGQKRRRAQSSVRVVVEAYCYACGEVWVRGEAVRIAQRHAEETGHKVRMTRTVVTVFNERNGEQHGREKAS